MEDITHGQSMFEIIFVIAITALILTGVVSLSAVSVRNTSTASNQGLSSKYLREAVDFLRQQRDADWNSFTDRVVEPPGRTWCLQSLSWPTDYGECADDDFVQGTNNLIREVILSYPDATTTNKVEATVTTEWKDSQGTHIETINTTFVDWNDTEFLHD